MIKNAHSFIFKGTLLNEQILGVTLSRLTISTYAYLYYLLGYIAVRYRRL